MVTKEIVEIDNKSENKDYQQTLRDRGKGGIHVGVRMLAIFQKFKREENLPAEMIPYFKEFLSNRTPEAKYFMTYFNKAIKNEEKRIGDLNFE